MYYTVQQHYDNTHVLKHATNQLLYVDKAGNWGRCR